MPSEEIENGTSNQIMSMGEAEGRRRQWVRDINGAYQIFLHRLPSVTKMKGARRGSKMKGIRNLATKLLAPALVFDRYSSQGCELYLLDANGIDQLVLVKVIVDHMGRVETLPMNFHLSHHFIARVLQYYRVRQSNPLNHPKLHELLAALPQLHNQSFDPKNLKVCVSDEDGVRAEICCAEDVLDNGDRIYTATTFIVSTSLYPKRYREAEEMLQSIKKKKIGSCKTDEEAT